MEITGKSKFKIYLKFCFFALLSGMILSGYVSAELIGQPTELWNKTAGGSSADYVYDVVVDSDDNIVVAGETWSFSGVACPTFSYLFTLEPKYVQYLKEGPVSNAIIKIFGDNKIFLSDKADITLEGDKYWRVKDSDRTYKIKDTGTQLNVYSCASGEIYETANMWLIKYDSGGNVLWNKTAGMSFSDDSSSLDYARSVAIDSNNNIIITGTRTIKYDSFGNVLWDKSACGNDVAVDSDNNVIITCFTDSPGGTVTRVLIAKYDSKGGMLWNKTAGGNSNERSSSIAVDSENNIIITGHAWSFNESGSDVWTIKYDSSGNVLWNKTAGGDNHDMGLSVSVDSKNNVIITGVTGYEGGMLGTGGCIWTIKYDSNGNMLWNKTTGGTGYASGYGVLADLKDNIIVTGTMDSSNLLVIKYDSEGNMLWNKTAGSPSGGHGIALDSKGNVIIAGWVSFFGPGKEDVWVIKYSQPESALLTSGTEDLKEKEIAEEEIFDKGTSEKQENYTPKENAPGTQEIKEKDSPMKTYLIPAMVIFGIILLFLLFKKWRKAMV